MSQDSFRFPDYDQIFSPELTDMKIPYNKSSLLLASSWSILVLYYVYLELKVNNMLVQAWVSPCNKSFFLKRPYFSNKPPPAILKLKFLQQRVRWQKKENKGRNSLKRYLRGRIQGIQPQNFRMKKLFLRSSGPILSFYNTVSDSQQQLNILNLC